MRLLKGLVKQIPDEAKRKAHILENMLYMVELNGKNVTTLKKRFGEKCHIYHGDFLTHDFRNTTFEGILGNPPFQVSKSEVYKGSVGNRVLWTLFIKNVLENQLLKPKGYLGFITPSSWRRPEHALYKPMVQENYLRYLHIYSKKEGMKVLGVQTRFDVYVIQKENPSKRKSIIVDEKGTHHSFSMIQWPFLPNSHYDSFRKIMVPKELTFGIPIASKHEGEQWKEVIESPFFQDILEASKWNSFQTDYRMFSYFSKDKEKYRI